MYCRETTSFLIVISKSGSILRSGRLLIKETILHSNNESLFNLKVIEG
jgi:hypothetical protein